MARFSIKTVESRAKLPARPKPYWESLRRGCSLGFRKLAAGDAGTWYARTYDAGTRKDSWRGLGSFEQLRPHERYTAAKKEAEALAEHVEHGGTASDMTVKRACDAYVEHLRAEGKAGTASDAQARFKRWVHGSKLAGVELRKLALHHVRAWRQGLIAKPVTVNPYADAEDQITRERSAASVNRDMTALRAALNLARDSGGVATDAGWRSALLPIEGANRRRELYLDLGQRRALIAKADADLATLLRGLSLVPLRPGALAALTVASLDRRLSTLAIGKDKHGAERRILLPAMTAAFFAEQAKGKLPAAPLLSRADGKAWDKDAWKKPIKTAAAAAELPANTTAYTLRHSVITDLVAGGLDVLTVARLAGTSVLMIERHYGHLRAAQAAAALATLVL